MSKAMLGASAQEVLEHFRQAAVEQSVEGMQRVYAINAVHEFPFTRPGLPSRLEGREQIVSFMADNWKTTPLKYEKYHTLALHTTDDPGTIIVEQEVVGKSATTGNFVLPNIVVLTVQGGQIIHLRDYVNVMAAAAATGRKLH